jgi:hypothetical protein
MQDVKPMSTPMGSTTTLDADRMENQWTSGGTGA